MISSVIVKCLNGAEKVLPTDLAQIQGVSVEKIHNGDIILLLESPSLEEAAQVLQQQIALLPGVSGAYPVYISMEM